MSKNYHLANLKLLARELSINYFNASTSKTFEQIEDISIRQQIFHKNFGERVDKTRCLLNQDRDFFFQASSIQEVGIEKSWCRSILVLGAGATYNSFRDIPLATQAIHDIQQKLMMATINVSSKIKETINFDGLIYLFNPSVALNRRQKVLRNIIVKDYPGLSALAEKYYAEKQRLHLYTPEVFKNSGSMDFETALALLSRFFPISKVRDLVYDKYKHRHGPTLFYELIAHLFKHRFIDVIINFNFDEFLDQALNDELGNENYHTVLSDGDCAPVKVLLEQQKLKVPIYIKPHGTASHKSTLRFTKDHYNELPYDLRKLLISLFSDTDAPSSLDLFGKKDEELFTARRVNLITVGFAFGSLEFNEILKEHMPRGSRIFILHEASGAKGIKQKEALFEQRLREIYNIPDSKRPGEEILAENTPAIHTIAYNQILRKSFKEQGTLGHILLNLWKRIQSHFNEAYKPPSIQRHLIVWQLFGCPKAWEYFIELEDKERVENAKIYPAKYFRSPDYFLDRTVLEIFLALAKGKGIVDPNELLHEKVGTYYAEYRKKKGTRAYSLEQILDLIGINNPINSTKNVLNPKKYTGFTNTGVWSSNGLANGKDSSGSPLDRAIDRLFSNSLKKLLRSNISDESWCLTFWDSFKEISNSYRSVIKANFNDPQTYMFVNFQPLDILNTKLAVTFKVLDSIRQIKKLDTLFMVAESGLYFKNFKSTLFNPDNINEIVLILAYPGLKRGDLSREGYSKFIGERVGNENLSNLKVLLLPTERHNEHMKLFFNAPPDHGGLIGKGIYYNQRGYSEHINPMQVESPMNMFLLLSQFEDYIREALTFDFVEHSNFEATLRKINCYKKILNSL